MVKKTLPTTIKMVDKALLELHSTKGVSLKKLCNFIQCKYDIVLSKRRASLIKKHLYRLKESSFVRNKTGKGLSGSIKLTDKKSFLKLTDLDLRLTSSTRMKTKAPNPKTVSAAQIEKTFKAARMYGTPSDVYIRKLMEAPSPVLPIEPEAEGIIQMTPRSSLPVEKPIVGVPRRLFR